MCHRFQHENLIKLLDHVINEREQTEALLLFPYYQVCVGVRVRVCVDIGHVLYVHGCLM